MGACARVDVLGDREVAPVFVPFFFFFFEDRFGLRPEDRPVEVPPVVVVVVFLVVPVVPVVVVVVVPVFFSDPEPSSLSSSSSSSDSDSDGGGGRRFLRKRFCFPQAPPIGAVYLG